ncbi:lytic transglycosylase domain-containing protein [Paraflavitalea pollutisoli]|uniref:lytic transglycosylase domain-containing protein n=1 Tax=Paraflavitalea pollutisoli TaxID=3034143 RepID=UPI0023EBE6FD|nr:lytic transglycosylase domain-containing protein [Paraflavitalea sp. H1-2-19X]
MKRKLVYASVFGLVCLLMAFDTGGKKKTSSQKPAAKSTQGRKLKATIVLNDTIQSPAKSDSLSDPGFTALFENSSSVRLNPRAISFVQDYMEKNTEDLMEIKEWGRPYFTMMENILGKYGLPTELKYLAVIESRLKRSAVSWAGAVGPWQLMPATARILGLKVSQSYDERKDYTKSTHAAAKYLKDLYNEFGDWLLVIAAYNGGPGNVYSAIRKSGSRNFWNLQYYLPAESRTHVKKFIGTHYIFEGQGSVTTLTKAEATEQMGVTATYLLRRNLSTEEMTAAKSVTVSGKYHSSVIARHIAMDANTFERYNPDFDKKMASADNAYELKLPVDKMELFQANKYAILNESVQLLLSGATVANKDAR